MPFFVMNKCCGSAHNIYSGQLLDIKRNKNIFKIQCTKDFLQISHKSHQLTADDRHYSRDDLKLHYG